ncbi:MAG: nuclear transport factor 2 family protein [Alphaproteobacteria bacterium]|nr:nuclear transport factor 2 family protein [Alphaproteobacteria bacterium]MBU0792458.1 nuclear transport factor 2 family protein [Alphaproteobacteria bacterium]MBU0876337.1 nuclear transport factor 2 family protein [Alphaproteobacteria bacterium]MBU1768262.1 nuclear transport factor 2 family protein [Alphaproteobacteria bacterium]
MIYEDYVADFNQGQDDRLVERWFAPDCVMYSSTRVCRGRQELLAFLDWAHDGVREILRPRLVLREGNRLFVDVDMDFICHAPRPDFPFAPLLPGDILTVRFFVTYQLNDDGLIQELCSMTWPAEQGVIKAPMLSAHAGGRAAYHAYATAFSAGDMERAGRYYTEDCVLRLPSVPVMSGRDAICEFYRTMFQTVREDLTVHGLVIDDNGIAVDCTSTFTAQRDAPDFVVAPLKKGESIQVRVFVVYSLRNGQIATIDVARAGAVAPPVQG